MNAAVHFTTAAICLAAAAWVLIRTILNAARYLDDAAVRGLL